MNAEQAVREAEQRFPDYRAEAMCTCGVYRLALIPRVRAPHSGDPARIYELTDARLYSEGSSYEGALAAARPPTLEELVLRR
jgi:hypothetical protein